MKEKYCIVEGGNRKLRTGNKYCYIHRSFQREKGRSNNSDILMPLIAIIIFLVGIGIVISELANWVMLNPLKAIFSFCFTALIFGGIIYGLGKIKNNNRMRKEENKKWNKKKEKQTHG